MTTTRAEDILTFWFDEHGQSDWFGGGEDFDRRIVARFQRVHRRARAGELWSWRSTPEGRLAEIIVLDQFSRQIYRKQAAAFAADAQALTLAQEVVLRGDDQRLTADRRLFAYMPFMHSESLLVHDEAAPLFAALGEVPSSYAKGHRDLIAKYGRYPYRNAALGRANTPDEEAYLSSEHDSYGQ